MTFAGSASDFSAGTAATNGAKRRIWFHDLLDEFGNK